MTPRKRPGVKPTRKDWYVWAVDPFDPKNSSTSALISMCIKEDMKQTLKELAARVSEYKNRPYKECLAVIRDMAARGTLGYFECDDVRGYYFAKWEPGRTGGRKNGNTKAKEEGL